MDPPIAWSFDSYLKYGSCRCVQHESARVPVVAQIKVNIEAATPDW